MPAQDIRLPNDASAQYVLRLTAGLDISDDPDDIDASKASSLDNVKFFKGQLQSESGYKKFQNIVVGVPRRQYKFVKADQSIEYLLITNTTFYRRLLGEWQYVSNGVKTTTDAIEPAGETVISVVSVTGFLALDRIGITLDNGTQHRTTIVSINVGLNDITINDAIPVGRQVDNGDAVVKAASYSGNDDRQISIVTDPSNDWVIFTNGVDPVQRYDTTAGGTVTALAGLSVVNVNTCRTLALYYNTLFLGFTTESSTNKPQRVRNSATGNYESWNTGIAGFEDFFDEEDDIKRLETLGPYLIAYRAGSIRRGEWTEDPDDIVNWDTMISDRGVVSHDSVIPVGSRHICIDESDIYEYQGSFEAPSIAGDIFEKLFGVSSEVAPAFFQRAFGFHLKALREVFIFWPDINDSYPTRVARLSLKTDAWSVRTFVEEISGWGIFEDSTSKAWTELTGTWADQGFIWASSIIQAAVPTVLLGGKDDLQIFEYDFINATDDGSTIPWHWASKNFLHPELEIRIDSFSFFAKGANILLEYSTDKGKSWQTYESISLTASTERYEVYNQFIANQVMWRFSGSGSGFAIDWFSFSFGFEGEKR